MAAAALTAATAFGLARLARHGRLRPATGLLDPGLLSRLGVQPGTPITLLQFSAQYCAQCRPARAVLAEVAETTDGVQHIEVDVDVHPDAVQALDVRRVPTVLVIDGAGRVVSRAVGAPTRERVLDALASCGTVTP